MFKLNTSECDSVLDRVNSLLANRSTVRGSAALYYEKLESLIPRRPDLFFKIEYESGMLRAKPTEYLKMWIASLENRESLTLEG